MVTLNDRIERANNASILADHLYDEAPNQTGSLGFRQASVACETALKLWQEIIANADDVKEAKLDIYQAGEDFARMIDHAFLAMRAAYERSGTFGDLQETARLVQRAYELAEDDDRKEELHRACIYYARKEGYERGRRGLGERNS